MSITCKVCSEGTLTHKALPAMGTGASTAFSWISTISLVGAVISGAGWYGVRNGHLKSSSDSWVEQAFFIHDVTRWGQIGVAVFGVLLLVTYFLGTSKKKCLQCDSCESVFPTA